MIISLLLGLFSLWLSLNILTYFVFKKYFLGKTNAAMKFLAVNIMKDLLWIILSLITVEKTTTNFLILIALFAAGSIVIYTAVIRAINKS